MVAPLSISTGIKQAAKYLITVLGPLFLVLSDHGMAQSSSWLQPGEVEWRTESLSAIDQQFMASQRQTVESLANKLGRSLSGTTQRDLDTLQLILDRKLVPQEDILTLQALGVVLGDLLGDELNMQWVVYRDRAGRSRALRYLSTDIFIFPVTLISRRWSVGSDKAVTTIYQDTVDATASRLPGASWR